MGMGFKEIAYNDIRNVFINPEEFGELHELNGKRMMVIVDTNEVEARGKKQFEHSRIDGVYENNMLIYVSRKDFGRQPGHGIGITFDGKTYRVNDCRDEGGVYSIILGAFGS